MRGFLVLSLIIGVSALVGCRTNDETSEVEAASAEASPSPTPELKSLGEPAAEPEECPVASPVCSTEYNPVVCSATHHKDEPLAESLMVWGSNPCDGELKLARAACKQKLRPSKLGRVQCVPDSSNGHCPFEKPVCAADFAPSYCTATSYGEQALKADQILGARGSNACIAKGNLAEQACRRNLDPKKLGGVTCEPDKLAAECPVQENACGDAPRETTCTAKRADGKSLGEPIVASGSSPCAAKQAMAREACRRGFKPSGLDEIICQKK